MPYGQYRCNDCGCLQGFRSRPRTLTEKYLLPLFLLRPVRCAKCFRRDYKSLFLSIPERPHRGLTSDVAA